MLEFLQSYGGWIIFGLLFLVMLRLHGSMGCGMGGHNHSQTDQGQGESDLANRGTTAAGAGDRLKKRETTASTTGHRSGGCH